MGGASVKILRHLRLLTVVTAAQCTVAAALRVASIARVRASVRACRGAAAILVPRSNEQIAWAIEATGRRLGTAGSCLVRALVAEMLLDGSDGVVRVSLGVKHDADGSLRAHAWVTRNDRILVGAPAHDYVPIVTWTASNLR